MGRSTSKGIFSFLHHILPKGVLLDTNFILNLTCNFTGYPASFKEDCANFIQAIIEKDGDIYITDWVLEEVLFQIIELKLQEKVKPINDKYEQLGKKERISPMNYYYNHPGIIKEIFPTLKEVYNDLMKLSRYRKLEESSFAIREKSLSLIKDRQLLPTDAYIVATAIVNEPIEAVVTCDVRHFRKVRDRIAIYVPDDLYRTI